MSAISIRWLQSTYSVCDQHRAVNFQEKAGVIVLDRVQVAARGSYWPRAEDAHNVHAYIVL